MDVILASGKWEHAIVYIDDIIIFPKTQKRHLLQIEEVLRPLREVGIKIKLKKCIFFSKKLTYLAQEIATGK